MIDYFKQYKTYKYLYKQSLVSGKQTRQSQIYKQQYKNAKRQYLNVKQTRGGMKAKKQPKTSKAEILPPTPVDDNWLISDIPESQDLETSQFVRLSQTVHNLDKRLASLTTALAEDLNNPDREKQEKEKQNLERLKNNMMGEILYKRDLIMKGISQIDRYFESAWPEIKKIDKCLGKVFTLSSDTYHPTLTYICFSHGDNFSQLMKNMVIFLPIVTDGHYGFISINWPEKAEKRERKTPNGILFICGKTEKTSNLEAQNVLDYSQEMDDVFKEYEIGGESLVYQMMLRKNPNYHFYHNFLNILAAFKSHSQVVDSQQEEGYSLSDMEEIIEDTYDKVWDKVANYLLATIGLADEIKARDVEAQLNLEEVELERESKSPDLGEGEDEGEFQIGEIEDDISEREEVLQLISLQLNNTRLPKQKKQQYLKLKQTIKSLPPESTIKNITEAVDLASIPSDIKRSILTMFSDPSSQTHKKGKPRKPTAEKKSPPQLAMPLTSENCQNQLKRIFGVTSRKTQYIRMTNVGDKPGNYEITSDATGGNTAHWHIELTHDIGKDLFHFKVPPVIRGGESIEAGIMKFGIDDSPEEIGEKVKSIKKYIVGLGDTIGLDVTTPETFYSYCLVWCNEILHLPNNDVNYDEDTSSLDHVKQESKGKKKSKRKKGGGDGERW